MHRNYPIREREQIYYTLKNFKSQGETWKISQKKNELKKKLLTNIKTLYAEEFIERANEYFEIILGEKFSQLTIFLFLKIIEMTKHEFDCRKFEECNLTQINEAKAVIDMLLEVKKQVKEFK